MPTHSVGGERKSRAGSQDGREDSVLGAQQDCLTPGYTAFCYNQPGSLHHSKVAGADPSCLCVHLRQNATANSQSFHSAACEGAAANLGEENPGATMGQMATASISMAPETQKQTRYKTSFPRQ